MEVSIPFIAGQWSLHQVDQEERRKVGGFQSPSLRGSGRFLEKIQFDAEALLKFQSPSLRGSGRFKGEKEETATVTSFQSPSLRGSGRFNLERRHKVFPFPPFQSPSLRGSGRFVFWGLVGYRLL